MKIVLIILIILMLFFIFVLTRKHERVNTLYILEEDGKIKFLLFEEVYLVIDINKNCKVSKIDCIKEVLAHHSTELSKFVDNIIYLAPEKEHLNREFLNILKNRP